MKMYDVSQLPVMGDNKLLGIISEMDILIAVTGHPEGFLILVSDAMAKNLVTVEVDSAIADLLPIFERGMVAIIKEKDDFLGLITPIDLLQYLRKRIGHA
jgi:cystathionine beta-synthase